MRNREITTQTMPKLGAKENRVSLLGIAVLVLVGSVALSPLMVSSAEAETSDGRFCIQAASDQNAFTGMTGNCRPAETQTPAPEPEPVVYPTTSVGVSLGMNSPYQAVPKRIIVTDLETGEVYMDQTIDNGSTYFSNYTTVAPGTSPYRSVLVRFEVVGKVHEVVMLAENGKTNEWGQNILGHKVLTSKGFVDQLPDTPLRTW